ncbi:hypothetical protein C8J56DRAFT_956129 [Mycena floridula]|nr:hypothetical protein C8J56DRAFT_956129 [Mycena floridula]
MFLQLGFSQLFVCSSTNSTRTSTNSDSQTRSTGLEDGSQSLSFLPLARIGRFLKSCSTSTTMVACNYCPNDPRGRLPVFLPLHMKLCQHCWDKVDVAWRGLPSKPHSKQARPFLSAYLHLEQVIQTYSDGITAVNWDAGQLHATQKTETDESSSLRLSHFKRCETQAT